MGLSFAFREVAKFIFSTVPSSLNLNAGLRKNFDTSVETVGSRLQPVDLSPAPAAFPR
jgi:hypothetical protein